MELGTSSMGKIGNMNTPVAVAKDSNDYVIFFRLTGTDIYVISTSLSPQNNFCLLGGRVMKGRISVLHTVDYIPLDDHS